MYGSHHTWCCDSFCQHFHEGGPVAFPSSDHLITAKASRISSKRTFNRNLLEMHPSRCIERILLIVELPLECKQYELDFYCWNNLTNGQIAFCVLPLLAVLMCDWKIAPHFINHWQNLVCCGPNNPSSLRRKKHFLFWILSNDFFLLEKRARLFAKNQTVQRHLTLAHLSLVTTCLGEFLNL